MSYSTFNDYIRNRFFGAENIGSYVVLSVDKQVINEFCKENNISEQQLNEEFRRLFSKNWNEAFKPDSFFGLAAIQVYIAHQMGEEHGINKDISAGNYRERLSMYFQIHDSALNKFLKKDGDQDRLWSNLKQWTEKFEFSLSLPEKSDGPWSKVKYPLSQSLLNQDDFRYLSHLYRNAGLNPFEQLCLDDFIGIIEKAENKDFMPPHFFKVKNRLIKEENEELLYKQMFEHYSNWTGETTYIEKLKKNGALISLANFAKDLLIFSQERQEIQIFKNQSPISNFSINSRDIFLRIKKHFKMPFGKVLFFTKDEYYGDWVFSRYLIKGETNLMISSSDETYEYHAKRIDSNCRIATKLSCVITVLEINDDYEPNSFWAKFFPQNSIPIKIMNGLKLDRKRWMFQAGPDLFFSKPIDAWVNGEKIQLAEDLSIISLRYCEVGLYTLKLRGFSPIKIEIDKPTIEKLEITNGWKISKNPVVWKSDSEPFQVCGLVNSFITEQDSNSEIRNWINANIRQIEKEKNQYNNQVTNAINRAKHGIQY